MGDSGVILRTGRLSLRNLAMGAVDAPKNLPSRRVAERVGMQLEKEIEHWNLRVLVYALER